jgi:zinc D-Ala-D-Ala dipeptidase
MPTKRFFYLSSIVLGIVLIPSTPALLQNVNSPSVTQTDKNSFVKDNPALLPPVTNSNPSTKTTDVKNPAQVISTPGIKLPDSAPSTKTTDVKNPTQVISLPDIKSSIPTQIPSIEAKNSLEITSEAKVKPSDLTRTNNGLVDLEKIAPHIRKDIRYATANNFMNRKLYPVSRCLLHAKVAEQLKQVQIELEKENLGLKVFDCYRPLSIQKQMWKILPDSNYVANPAQGSRHNRASAVDLTLIDFSTGKDKEMPSKYDEFSKRAHMDYQATSIESKKNRKHLRIAMEKHGFKSIPTEWWHYDSSEWKQYPLLDISWN